MAGVLSVGSLFSGIGGIDLGLERAGLRVVWQAEIDAFASRVLANHWPKVPNLGDVTKITSFPPADVLAGGFPCQDASIAAPIGRLGLRGPRTGLWKEFLRAIRQVRPRWVLAENVPGLFDVGFPEVLGDLAECGYDAEWDVLPASAFGSPQARFRIIILAYPANNRRTPEPIGLRGWSPGPNRWPAKPRVCRAPNGLPGALGAAVKAYGNAVVPQLAEWIGTRILQAEGGLA